jgi:hypothetical protein
MVLNAFILCSCVQTSSATKSNADTMEDILEIAKMIEENGIIKQSEILDYDDLPGTFWVRAEPEIIDGKRFYFYGYIFFDSNYMIIVEVEQINDRLY